jgi:hypothetical protein
MPGWSAATSFSHFHPVRLEPVRKNHSGAHRMKTITLPLVFVASLAVSACGSTTGSRAGSGALMGAAGGALIGSLSANAGTGALIGAGAGAVGGYLYDQHQKGNID